jgi:hypothetical protein
MPTFYRLMVHSYLATPEKSSLATGVFCHGDSWISLVRVQVVGCGYLFTISGLRGSHQAPTVPGARLARLKLNQKDNEQH